MNNITDKRPRIGVIGASVCPYGIYQAAYDIGRIIANHNAILISGGLGGVMEGASKGAFEHGGMTVGILPTRNPADANPYVKIPIPTGLGHARNILVVQSSQIVIAIDGKMGTLSEIAIALKIGLPVIGYRTWEVDPRIKKARSVEEISRQLDHLMENL